MRAETSTYVCARSTPSDEEEPCEMLHGHQCHVDNCMCWMLSFDAACTLYCEPSVVFGFFVLDIIQCQYGSRADKGPG